MDGGGGVGEGGDGGKVGGGGGVWGVEGDVLKVVWRGGEGVVVREGLLRRMRNVDLEGERVGFWGRW